jgi:predicted Rossmann-fold nucleotide-binding protein
MANLTAPAVAVFTSDRGPGDPERVALMSDVGRVFAKKGAAIYCLAENGVLPLALITAARTAGGQVTLVADAEVTLPTALREVSVTVIPERAERHAYLAGAVAAFVALPGSLASASGLFGAWAGGPQRPVVMLNRHRAFELVRGFAADVLSHSVAGHDRNIQFADTVDDLWNKVVWVVEQAR